MHIIFVITFAPKYEFVGNNVPQPVHSWINPEGMKISIWNEDWGIVFGKNMLEKYPDVTFEVLRGDFRADKMYSYKFEEGLLYKSFPAKNIKFIDGIKRREYIYSEEMEQYIADLALTKKDDYLLLIPAERTAFTIKFTEIFQDILPIVHFHFTNNRGLFKKVDFSFNPLKLLHRFFIRRQRKKLNKKIRFLQVVHKEGVRDFDDFSKTDLELVSFGIDTKFWRNVETKEMVRKRLGFGDEKIILFSSRLVKPYQIIEAIQVLSKFKKKNFLAIFTSYGEKAYVREIEEKIKNTGMSSRIILTGYISNEEMRDYYSACDVFMMTSIVNAGPASTYKAIMMNKPVITTDSGRASEILKENQAGYIIPTQNLKKWEEAIDYFLSGNKIPVLNGETVPEFNWEYSLKKWHELFRRAIQKNTSV